VRIALFTNNILHTSTNETYIALTPNKPAYFSCFISFPRTSLNSQLLVPQPQALEAPVFIRRAGNQNSSSKKTAGHSPKTSFSICPEPHVDQHANSGSWWCL